MVPSFLHALRRQRLALLGWGAGLFLLALLVTNIYTSFVAEQLEDVKDLINSLPGELKKFAKLGDITSPKGFLDGRYFLVMPMLLGVYAGLAGAALLAEDEELGRMDLFLAHPISRRALFLGRALALLVALVAIHAFGWAGMAVGVYRTGMPLSSLDVAWPFLSLLAVVVLTAALGLLFSMVLPARHFAGTAAILVIVVSFFLTGFARVDESLEPAARLLPIRYYQGADAISGLNWSWFLGLLTAALAATGLAYALFELRDIRVAGEGVVPWRQIFIAAGVAAVAVAVPVLVALRPVTYSTPEAAFEGTVAAMEAEDWRTFARGLTPAALDEWNAVLVVPGAALKLRGGRVLGGKVGEAPQLTQAQWEGARALFEMMPKYRGAMRHVEMDGAKKRETEVLSVGIKLFPEMVPATVPAFLRPKRREAVKLTEKERELASLVKEPEKFLVKAMRAWAVAHEYKRRPRLEGLEVDGDTARATVVLPDGEPAEARFEKENGSWRVGLPFWRGDRHEAGEAGR